ncbi:GH116 family glycosyl-hydrolase [Coraliomargarita sp. SDUM461004]|uniref:GH116 family glycosyl-hydrolase n=1 Tax=Thalassobacterium sedimentorum TaxID=3041258 RepID=A0ABU1ALH1_9BACT|nr:GH116 family glycosyl-hydrolase [Coraliomargarita sp. SDUM461004]MDQ8195645.1 GH116 family glycosyl-hydrolase [Coraliomargarita sp. SDUM461004]
MSVDNYPLKTTGDNSAQSSLMTAISRRKFIQAGGLSSALLLIGRLPVMAGPFTAKDFEQLIPADKKLSANWIAALTKRGAAEVFSGEELKYIGMPIGGIGCGQLYLAGDGRLWHWDIFKSNYKREKHEMKMSAMTMGGHYPHPVAVGEEYTHQNGEQVAQGFAIRVQSGDQSFVRSLDGKGFPGVTFRGEYPVGRVTYRDPDFPAEVQLEAFSPFIPLNTKDSALPATTMRYTVTNTSDAKLKVDLGGYLQNAICPYTVEAAFGQRRNQLQQSPLRTSVLSTVEGSQAITKEHGYGSSAFTILSDAKVRVSAAPSIGNPQDAKQLFTELDQVDTAAVTRPLDELLVGGMMASMELAPGESRVITCLVTWYFPYHQKREGHVGQSFGNRHYLPWFESAGEVAEYIAGKSEELIDGTLLWNRTWYDSSLPYWLLDRSMIALDCLATQTFHWFDDGRPWAWEGVDCCEGTCTHVFHYAQAMGRIFPELERSLREKTDYGQAFIEETGGIGYRGYSRQKVAEDGQAGTILRVYREHQMSADDAFLKRLWPRVKQSIEYLMTKDPDEDGIMTGAQQNTLDAAWTGKFAWMSSMYLGALAAGEAMASEVGDDAFANKCRKILDQGYQNIVSELFDGEYFIHKPGPPVGKGFNTNIGCHIDQVLGQSWMHQVGLGRVIPKKETVSALESIWKYNFAPDAGGYALKHREIEEAFRWYAMEGEAGLLMTTWPKGGAKDAIPGDTLRSVENPEMWTGPGGYFNECMNGFEYQVAWHMVAEAAPDSSLLEKGLAIMKAVHDRYGAAKRNPYNEIECGDHYARSMASYGIFLTVCGFTYHGPKGAIGFDPKIHPDNFKAPFTAAEGWGTYSQQLSADTMHAQLKLNWGSLSMKTLQLAPRELTPQKVEVSYRGEAIAAVLKQPNGQCFIELEQPITLATDTVLDVKLS